MSDADATATLTRHAGTSATLRTAFHVGGLAGGAVALAIGVAVIKTLGMTDAGVAAALVGGALGGFIAYVAVSVATFWWLAGSDVSNSIDNSQSHNGGENR